MSELATKNRAEELAEAIVRNVPRLPHCYDELIEELGVSEASVQYECDLAKLIEQALLAERAQVWEEAAKIAHDYLVAIHVNELPLKYTTLPKEVAKQLRAAAEKEVGK